MSKEMLIIFVYDTQMLQMEEDDPCSAILYFHPPWVSDQQKTALCGQVMGTVQCVKSIFARPKIVSLQSGKFHIEETGRYLMAIGTDRSISNWLLENRAETISGLIHFFHENIEELSQSCGNTAKLSAKLYQFFETYLKYLFFGGGIFSYIPSINLPKSGSNVFLEAIQILQTCQDQNYVLGGALFYHNKVVATQLSSETTKKIVLTDPYRIKSPAEVVETDFDLPLGVQLLQIYIPSKEFLKLHENAMRCKNIHQFLNNKSQFISSNRSHKEPVMSAMKRDQSIIFSSVPEEDSIHENVIVKKSPKKQRPKFLNLKNKVSDFTSSVTENKKILLSSQASVCSTPMTELNKVIHCKPLSICANDQENLPGDFEDIECVRNCAKITGQFMKLELKKSASSMDVRANSIKKESITLKYYEAETEPKNLKKNSTDSTLIKNTRRMTISDPFYPHFRPDGTQISHSFYEISITTELKHISNELPENKHEKKVLETFAANSSFMVESCNKNEPDDTCYESIEMASLPPKKSANFERRKSLNLPLKSSGQTDSSWGVLPTPLMSKLTSFCDESKEKRIFTPTTQKFPFPFASSKTQRGATTNRTLQKCVLFVCGQQDMVVTLLLQDEAAAHRKLVKTLFEICTDNLGKLEKQLRVCLETFQGNNQNDNGEPYSFLSLDQEWDTVSRGGPWSSADLGTLTYFHRDFIENKDLTEILMRCCDGVIYGHKCGQNEIFYHQSAAGHAGLPTPADAMGNVPLKAKRRLERDHSIILL